MNTDTLPAPAIAGTEAVTFTDCAKAAWALTALAEQLLDRVYKFNRQFDKFADDGPLEAALRDAAGLEWALDMFVSVQHGQLPIFDDDGCRLAPAPNGE